MEECETKDPKCSPSCDNIEKDDTCTEEWCSSEILGDDSYVEETLSNSDNLEIESGVESATGDVAEADFLGPEFTGDELYLQLGDLDLTTEQAQETLKYFTLASDRTNQMSKTYNDLDAILQLLQEKEKDLELAARIGQETQLQHEVSMKNELLQKFIKDQEMDEFYQLSHRSDEDSRSSDSSCRDVSITSLQQKCQALEQQNTHLIFEALQLKEETATVEMKEQQLVLDCVRQLVEAKDQISDLTDEISQKAEDNIRQQEEITHLITTVVDLQKRHKQLSMDNEELQSLLNSSTANQSQLQNKVDDLSDKYHECLEMLMENQDARDSIALEIEESVKRDLTSQQEKREHTARVMETVRAINTKRTRKGVSSKSKNTSTPEGSGFKFTYSPSVNESKASAEGAGNSQAGNPVAERRVSYGRRPFRAPEKLQIVKPIKGSVTLHQWKKLANPTLNLAETRPGVHVKGEGADASENEPRERKESSDLDADESEEDEPLYMNLPRTSESTSEAVSQTGTEDGDEDDEPIQMRVPHGLELGTTSKKKEETVAEKGSSKKAPPQNLGLISLVSGQGFQGGFKERGGDSGSILTHLLNSPSSTSSGTSSVGKVLADVLSKASKEASEKEPNRAESLRNLANYFSEKERGNSTAPSQVKSPTSPPPVVPFTSTLPSSGGGMLLSKILGTSGLSAGLTIPAPITTTAKTSGLPSTTSSTSTTPSVLTRSTLVRNSSGTNLLSLAQGAMVDDASNKRHSLDSSQLLKNSNNSKSDTSPGLDFSELKFPTLRRRASSGDLQEMGSLSSFDQFGSGGLGARLKRSSSIGNMKDLSNDSLAGPSKDGSEGGFFGRLRRTPSIGSLTSLVQRSNFSVGFPSSLAGSKLRSTSLDALPVFKPGESPPSPSKFDQDSGNFFGKNAPSSSLDAIPGATGGFFGGGTKLSSLAGVRGFWSQGGSKSLESPAPPVQAPPPKSEERLEKITNAFAFEDFGGLGLMSFFGGKLRGSRSDSQ
ncbi:Trafficking kinesin-binding protein 1 [Stylophora pistillata]|uniref:Trafficking kinesin-binding protein 1 n=1 Tax=Stylophora pistillata TaxID=50429 RepID=A0A2B4RZK8_STYPI|nr:Trafficking kinesin-binding protein 1 [Stylophora pistillata]